jgi:excisionase family DNA binding protein
VLRVVLGHQQPHQPGTDPPTKNVAPIAKKPVPIAPTDSHTRARTDRARPIPSSSTSTPTTTSPASRFDRRHPVGAIDADRRRGRITEAETLTPAANSRVWTVSEAAVLLGVSRAHAYELVARGQLRHVRLGRRVVVPKRAVDGLLEGRTA